MNSRLQGKVFIVTGAGRMRGIGRATVMRLAQEGADIVVSAQPRDPASYPEQERAAGWRGAESVAEEVRQLGRRAIAVECDVTQEAQVQEMVSKAIATFGRIDGVVNNAGVPGGAGTSPIIDLPEDQWRQTIDVNLNGVYLVCKHVAKALRTQGEGGAIVNLSSLAGRYGMAGYGAYCASKFAVIGLTQQLAQELARDDIRVNCICPGSVDTNMMEGTFERTANRTGHDTDYVKKAVVKSIPMRRQGSTSEQASAIAFLLSADAGYITGQSLNVDGGLRMD